MAPDLIGTCAASLLHSPGPAPRIITKPYIRCMNVHLAIPDLLWPTPDDRLVQEGLALPALELLLGKGRVTSRPNLHLENWLLRHFDVESGSAPYALHAEGGEPTQAVWMRADPCHMRLNRDGLILADASTFELDREEAEALVEALNRHFAVDGMIFYPMQPERWYLRLEAPPAIDTTPIDEARGRDIDALLPRGEASMHWRRTLNEIQMLLHQHPINEEREARGALPINSVWLWGAGMYEATTKRPYNRVRSRDPLAVGLAQASGAVAMPLPDNATQWLGHAPNEGIELLVLDALAAPASYAEAHAWRTGLEALERDWFAPLLGGLREGRIGMITVHAIGSGGSFDVETTRQDLRYFWRRAKSLASFTTLAPAE